MGHLHGERAAQAPVGRQPDSQRVVEQVVLRDEVVVEREVGEELDFRLDRRRFSRLKTHFSTFFKLYKKIIFSQANLQKFSNILQNFQKKKREFFFEGM